MSAADQTTVLDLRRPVAAGPCLEANTIAALLEGELSPTARQCAEAHLDCCSECRGLVVGLASGVSLQRTKRAGGPWSGSRDVCAWASTMQDVPGQHEPSLTAGAWVDHFWIGALLGRGGMGEVYLAHDTKLHREVAIKMVNSRLVHSRRARDRFLAEARMTARLNHPNIVTIHAVGEHDGRPYLALEYVPGKTLRRWLAVRRDVQLREALPVFVAVAEALVEAHRHGIHHRDLKPENVLIGDDGRVRVVDFGLAVGAAGGDAPPAGAPPQGLAPTGIVGTPRYMAPEQWRTTARGSEVDVWALGVMLYELASGGEHPYGRRAADDDTTWLAAMVSSDEPVDALSDDADVPRALRALIAQCLSKDPTARPTAQQVLEALQLLVHQPERGPRWRRLGAVGRLAAVVAVVAVATAGGLARGAPTTNRVAKVDFPALATAAPQRPPAVTEPPDAADEPPQNETSPPTASRARAAQAAPRATAPLARPSAPKRSATTSAKIPARSSDRPEDLLRKW